MFRLSLDEDNSYFKIQADAEADAAAMRHLIRCLTSKEGTSLAVWKEGLCRLSISVYGAVRDILQSNGWIYTTSGVEELYRRPADWFDLSSARFLKPEQYEIIKNRVVNKFRGVLQIKTGWGKSYVITYLNCAYKGKGRKLVLTNNNQVRDTLKLRAEALGVDTSDTKFINPIAFVNSNKWEDPEELKWFEDVELIQIDESESVPPSTKKILDLCKKKKFVYGYSASPEKIKGIWLKDWHVIRDITDDCLDVISWIGFSIYYIAPKKEIKVNLVKTSRLMNEVMPYKLKFIQDERAALMMKQMASQDNLFKNGVLYSCIDLILKHKTRTLYIPYKFTKHGDMLYNYFSARPELSVIQWDGKKMRANKSELSGIDDIAARLATGTVDLFLASSVSYRGVDFRNIYDIFMYISSQFNDVTQIVGRGGRGEVEHPICVYLLENENDNTPFYSILHRSRKKKFVEIFKAPVECIGRV